MEAMLDFMKQTFFCFFFLTDDVQHVGVLESPVLVLHHAGVVPFIRRNHRLHYQSPSLTSDLKGKQAR